MASPFDYAWIFLKAETPGRDAMMQALTYNMNKPDKFGNIRQMKINRKTGHDPSAEIADEIEYAQERMRTGDINDRNDHIKFGDEDYPSDEYDMRPTENREPFDESEGEGQPIGGHNENPRSDRSALRYLASELGMQHKDVPYPVPPEMFEQMMSQYQMMNQQ